MKEKLTAFIHNLILYDYILFGSVFVLFILFIILGIVVRRKVGLSIFLVLFSFALLFLGPTLGYIKMHEYLFKNSVNLTSQMKLNFTQAVVVKGTLTNESKFDFQSCVITANAYKVSGNAIKDLIFPFNPFVNMSILESDVLRGETREFKIIVEPFSYAKDYNISLGANCK
ncbi:DUF2393 domain-containing protein [bacterium]|nr:DUF2393 domain-containing protein [bacterium]MBU1993297.1 DUF2393 domain-containing protein [bacterium]